MVMTLSFAIKLVGGQTLSGESSHATFGIIYSAADRTLHTRNSVEHIKSLTLADKRVTVKELIMEKWTGKRI